MYYNSYPDCLWKCNVVSNESIPQVFILLNSGVYSVLPSSESYDCPQMRCLWYECLSQVNAQKVWRNRGREGLGGIMLWKLQYNSTYLKQDLSSPSTTTPTPWSIPIPPTPTCEAQSKVMKAEEECQMITKSPWMSPSHSQHCLPFYCPLHLPSPLPPPPSSQGCKMQLLSAVRASRLISYFLECVVP